MKLDKEAKEFISEVVKYAVTEAIKQANEDAQRVIKEKAKVKSTFDERRARAADVKAEYDRNATD